MRNLPSLNRPRNAGLTLIEILVALLVISIGLLGVAGLHASSLRNNYDALMRSHASALVAEIADRMRANREAALQPTSDYNTELTETTFTIDANSAVAKRDLRDWKNALAAQLPRGAGSVQIDSATRMVVITVQWGERDQSDPVSFVTRTEI